MPIRGASEENHPFFLNYEQVGRILSDLKALTDGVSIPEYLFPAEHRGTLSSGEAGEQLCRCRAARARFSQEVSFAFTFRDIAPDISEPKRWSKRHEALLRLGHSLTSASSLINDPKLPLKGMLKRTPAGDVSAVIAGIDTLIAATNYLAERLKRPEFKAALDEKQTPGDAFYFELAEVFKNYFGKITFRHKGDWAEGPFVTFVQSICRELGEHAPLGGAIRKGYQRSKYLGDKAN